MPLQATSGAASYDGFGGGVAAVPNYIEDVFSTYLYTGNGSTQTITNGIDLSGKGGLVWIKARTAAESHSLYDTSRGANWQLQTNSTAAQQKNDPNSPWFSDYSVTSFNAAGFSLGAYYSVNGSTLPEVSWTFREQPKFFDVVTYTGNGANRSIAHNLGSAPGCIIIKCTSTAKQWTIWHRAGTQLNNFCAYFTTGGYIDQGTSTWGTNGGVPSMTSTTFSLGFDGEVNQSGATYVAYLFAHNAGGFGLTGTDNVISCGSYTGTGAVGNKITLGYEPQWLLIKRTDTANSWYLFDTMRGLSLTQSLALLPNGTNSDLDYGSSFQLNADGVTQNNANSAFNASGGTYIYIAIRRGPMKVPTSGTSVFIPITSSAAAETVLTTGFPIDMQIGRFRNVVNSDNSTVIDRLRGVSTNSTQSGQALITSATSAEAATTNKAWQWSNTDFKVATDYGATSSIYYNFKRAPSFFDEVCYTGTGSARTVTHNLGVAPEMVIYRRRDTTANWIIYCLYNTAASSNPASNYLNFDASLSSLVTTYYDAPTSSVLNLKSGATNTSGGTYVAYLFATCAGVSKVGSYTGTGTTQQINCGFTSGARFVLIKRTNASLSAWYVWDSARGIVAGNDPYLLMNSSAAEVTSTDYIDTYSAGFEISSTAPAAINASGGTFIFLAIA